MCPTKIETAKQMKDNINTATKTFQRKISVEGVKGISLLKVECFEADRILCDHKHFGF